jgi:hypothetical protein
MPRSFVLLLACAGFALPVLPSVLQQMSMEQMTAASTEIVQGTVSASYTAMSGNTIFTHYTIQVTQRMKGPNNPTTDVAIPGGSLKGLRQSFPGMPVLNVGGNYMLFLWQGKTGPNQPVGLNQGIFDVGPDSSNQTMASRRASGEAMLGADGKPVMDPGVRMRMVDLRSRVASALTTGMSAALPPVQASAGVAK